MTKRVAIHEREAPIEEWVVAEAESTLGLTSIKLNLRGNRAWPDRLFFVPGGRPVLIEFKRPGDVPRPLQAHRHEQLRRWGYDVISTDDRDAAILHLTRAVEAALGTGTKGSLRRTTATSTRRGD